MTYAVDRLETVVDESIDYGSFSHVLVAQQHDFVLYFASHCRGRYTHLKLYQLSNIVFKKDCCIGSREFG